MHLLLCDNASRHESAGVHFGIDWNVRASDNATSHETARIDLSVDWSVVVGDGTASHESTRVDFSVDGCGTLRDGASGHETAGIYFGVYWCRHCDGLVTCVRCVCVFESIEWMRARVCVCMCVEGKRGPSENVRAFDKHCVCYRPHNEHFVRTRLPFVFSPTISAYQNNTPP